MQVALVRSMVSPFQFIYLFLYIFKCTYGILVPRGPRPSVTSTCKHSQLTEVVQYKTACSWSLLLLYNTVGSVLWVDETQKGCLAVEDPRFGEGVGAQFIHDANTIY